ncbi:hypothetical protein QE152_g9588 [Popillia japonica]|uniref:C2H2-type domain-containing protein n=1 Tax=Popillia japonica TaxID=7064 RepID=A0AAW1LY04_POPJA
MAESDNAQTSLTCCYCTQVFTRRNNLKRHIDNVHKYVLCKKCGLPKETCVSRDTSQKKVFGRCGKGHLRSQLHVSNNAQVLEEGIYKTATSFKNRIATYRITDSGKADISTFLESVKLKTCKLIQIPVKLIFQPF